MSFRAKRRPPHLRAVFCEENLLFLSWTEDWLSLIRNPKPHNAPQRLHSILPRNLLPFFIRPPGITDWNLIHSPVFLRYLCRNFRLEPEPVRLQLNVFQNLCTK